MTVQVSYLQKTECYPCTRREAKATFGDLELKWTGLGYPLRQFSFDRRSVHRPKVAEGDVVAEATYSPQREGWFSAYAMRRDGYPLNAREDFRERVLPEMRRWLQAQMAKPDTAVLGYEHFIVEWDGGMHNFHYYTWR
jgi:hypothetical protein